MTTPQTIDGWTFDERLAQSEGYAKAEHHDATVEVFADLATMAVHADFDGHIGTVEIPFAVIVRLAEAIGRTHRGEREALIGALEELLKGPEGCVVGCTHEKQDCGFCCRSCRAAIVLSGCKKSFAGEKQTWHEALFTSGLTDDQIAFHLAGERGSERSGW